MIKGFTEIEGWRSSHICRHVLILIRGHCFVLFFWEGVHKKIDPGDTSSRLAFRSFPSILFMSLTRACRYNVEPDYGRKLLMRK